MEKHSTLRLSCFCVISIFLLMLSWSLCAAAEEVRFDALKPGMIETNIYAGAGSNFRYPSATRNVFKFDIVGARISRVISSRTTIGLDLATGTGNNKGGSPNLWSTICFQQYLRANSKDALTFDLFIGVMRFRNKVPELATRTNFTERLGFTYKWKDGKNTAWTTQLTLSHISNADIKIPNIGINTCSVVFGHTWCR